MTDRTKEPSAPALLIESWSIYNIMTTLSPLMYGFIIQQEYLFAIAVHNVHNRSLILELFLHREVLLLFTVPSHVDLLW